MEISKFIDHTILKATARKEDINKLCEEAKKYNFFSVCVNGANVRYAYEQVKNSDVKVPQLWDFLWEQCLRMLKFLKQKGQ